ncbi:MAG: GNAT family N-acetyltransferase [Actinomycetota bacterium]|nr:GNAT family N-acetyltransferase [Actinomycetota bacterium]
MSGRRLERLGSNHQLGGFQSGNASLDRWLQAHALASQQMDVARTFVLVDGESVLGYFSLTMGSVHRAEAPPALVRGLPGYPVGIVLLARLAVEARAQGQGVGALLLAEALRKAVAASEAAAARLIVVDAIDDAAARFYLHHGFVFVPEHHLRLYRRTKDVRASQ